MSTRRERAEERFAGLRRRAVASAAAVAAPPAGSCVSTIARLAVNDPVAAQAVLDLQKHLSARFGELFVYPQESLHVTLLGLTRRREPATWAPAELSALVDAARAACAPMGPVDVRLGRLNLVGGQWFVEVTTDDPGWSAARVRLADRARARGGDPITFADPEPMHLNIARLARPTAAAELAETLHDPDLTVDREVRLGTVEVVVTDAVVAPDTLRVLDTIELGRGTR